MEEEREEKRRRTSECDREEERDRLSELPDCVLLHILKLINTKHAVQTCILSKRWKHLWKRFTTLSFLYYYFTTASKFNKFVSQLLSGRDHSTSLLDLHFRAYTSTSCRILNRVVKYAAFHNIQYLTIEAGFNFTSMSNAFVPIMFSSPTLKVLKISISFSCTPLLIPKSLGLPALEGLHLANVIFTSGDDDGAGECVNPFSTCTLLNTLVLMHCTLHTDVKVLCISNSSLLNLKIDNTHRLYRRETFEGKIVLSAPNLSSLTIMDHFSSGYHQLSSTCNLSFLQEANIETPSDTDYSVIVSLLQLLTSVKILTFSSYTLKIILNDLSKIATMRTQPPCFVRLESLQVKMNPYVRMSDMEVNKVVEYLLQNSPQPRVAVINC